MSFVSKGEKVMHNKVKGASPGTDGPLKKSAFSKKGDGMRSGAPHNMAPGSKDKTKHPVSEDGMSGDYESGPTAAKSEYDPASGKRAKSVADLRNAAKLINERSDADGASPTGSEGGQDSKHTSSSKNASGMMKSPKSNSPVEGDPKPGGMADLDKDPMEDPIDQEEETGQDQTHDGMTPNGKSRKKAKSLKDIKRKIAMGAYGD